MKIIGIDPGQYSSGVVMVEVWDGKKTVIFANDEYDNKNLLIYLRNFENGVDICLVENIEGMGMVVGRSTFETCKWIGRFMEAYEWTTGKSVELVSRKDEKTILCGGNTYRDPETGKSRKISDSMIKAAIRSRFAPVGAGNYPEVGTVKQPGPLFELKGGKDHVWSALAVVLTYLEKKDEKVLE